MDTRAPYETLTGKSKGTIIREFLYRTFSLS